MSDILLEKQSSPTTPSAGQAIIFYDTNALITGTKDENGRVDAYSQNVAVTSQAGGFAADTYVTNSDILIPSYGLQAKTIFRWTISASKTGAGVATPIYVVRIGTGRTTSDTAILTLTGPAQTAIADIGTLNILVTIRNVGASAVMQGTAYWVHRGTAANTTTSGTGFANDSSGHVEGTSAGFDSTATAGKYVGLSINGGTSAVWSPTQVISEALW